MDGMDGKTILQPSSHGQMSHNNARQELQGSNRDQQNVVQRRKKL
jgi:hypothetical protein